MHKIKRQERHPKALQWPKCTFLVAQLVKNPPAMWETWVRSLGWEDPLEKGKATQSSTLAWRIPWTIRPWGRKELDTTEQLSLSPSDVLSKHRLLHPFSGLIRTRLLVLCSNRGRCLSSHHIRPPGRMSAERCLPIHPQLSACLSRKAKAFPCTIQPTSS